MATKDNKRKRVAEGADVPNKKNAKAAIKVDFLSAKDELHPVIASSPGLSIPVAPFKVYSKSNSQSDGKSKSKSDTPAPSSHALLLQSSSHPKLDYTATEEDDPSLSHYIGVYDPSTASLQVLPAHSVTLRTTLRSESYQVEAEKAARSTFAQQREALGMEFGTKKAKKSIASKTENAITSVAERNREGGVKPTDAIEAAVLDSVNEASEALPARQEQQDSILASKPIPKPNMHAEKFEDVYPIAILIPTADLRAVQVKDWQDAVEANQDVKLTSRYVANRLATLVKSGDVTRLKALKYVLMCLEFNNALSPTRGGKKLPPRDKLKEKLKTWDPSALEAMKRRFADGSELNKWHYDRFMTHISAIALYIDNFRLDTNDLREDLRLENKQMSQYFMELGCRVAGPTEKEQQEFKIPNKAIAAQRRVAKLKLPLEFPKTRNPPRRR